ncbi:MAG: class I adenylate-forming enzyme family protein [Methanocorpusculum sp.]|nr:class I adenylate-forming enzyme family protein [Methanocorpusculum sp.]
MSAAIYRDDSKLAISYTKEDESSLYNMLLHGANHATFDATAIEYFNNPFTYRELLSLIDDCASGLLRLGVRRGDAVTIFLPNMPQCLAAIYACSRIGAAANMLHPQSTKEELLHALRLTGSKVVLTFELNEALCSNLPGITIIRCKVPEYFPKNPKAFAVRSAYLFKIRAAKPSVGTTVMEWADLVRDPQPLPPHEPEAEETGAIMYTGGTTGTSKGVMLSNRALNHAAERIILENVAGIPHIGDRVLCVLPLFHAYGFVMSVHATLSAGLCCLLMPKFSPAESAKLIKDKKIEYIMGVPIMYELLYPYLKDTDMYYCRQVLCGGDRVSPELVEKYNVLLKNSPILFRPGYGLTEASGGCFRMDLPYDSFEEGCVGVMFYGEGDEICVVTPGTTDVLPPGTEGELCIGGPVLMTGYYNDPEATNEVLIRHPDGKLWLHTGDIMIVDETGKAFFQSRAKRIVKVKGFNVYPTIIDNVMSQCPFVSKACAVGVAAAQDSAIKLYVVLNKLPRQIKTDDAVAAIMQFARDHLNEWSVPRSISVIQEMPMTKYNKVDFRALEKITN